MSYDTMVITTARLVLRPFTAADAPDIARLGMERMKSSFLPDWRMTGADAEGFARFLGERMVSPDPYSGPVVWAVTLGETGELIGNVGVGPKEELGGEVELGYAVSERYAGRGLATEAAKAAVWWAFERCGLDYLVAIVLPENAASKRVLDKLGFIPAGSRVINDCGENRYFEYRRFFHLDWYENPDWTPEYLGEPMDAFFARRVDGYEAHMLSYEDAENDYAEAVEPIAATDGAIDVLDLGCGTGLELRWLFERAPNARVTCVDLSGAMLEKLKNNHSDRLGQLTVVNASYIGWQYPEAAYDYVLSVNTMHHFLEPVKVGIYRNIRKALKRGGRYIESDFMVDDVRMEQYRRRCRRIMEAAGLGCAETGTLHTDMPMTPMLQQELLRSAGFAKVSLYREYIRLQHSKAILVAE